MAAIDLRPESGQAGCRPCIGRVDETLQRQVAIKLMNREIASDSDQLERFRREARAVAHCRTRTRRRDRRRRGPGAAVHRVRVRRGRDPEGADPSLRAPSIAEAVAYAIEIARALGAAHARHIVHRDVKPQNVLIDDEGPRGHRLRDRAHARRGRLTADGRVLGTTDYVSPEQALGQHVTGQSDLYSLGIVLYEMVTGDVPFKGENQVPWR